MPELSDKGISYNGGFFMLIVLALGGMVLGGLLSVPVIMMMTGQTITSVAEIARNPAYFRELQMMQSVSAIFGFLVPTLVSASLMSRRPLLLTGFKGAINGKQVLLTILIIGCGIALSGSLAYASYQIPFPAEWKAWFFKLESNYMKMAVNIINVSSPLELFISLIVLALVPAVCEEALFRGGLQNYLYRGTRQVWFSIIAVSLIFSLVHFSAYGFLSRLALGIILGLLYQYSGRLWLPILAHFINNAAAVLMIWYQKSNGLSITEIMSDRDGSYAGLAVIPVVIYFFSLFKRESRSNINTNGV